MSPSRAPFLSCACYAGYRPPWQATTLLSRSAFGEWNWFVQMVTAIPGRNLPVLNFAYHLPKPWTDRFARVNSKQPLFWLLDLLLFCSSSLPSLSPSPAGPVSEISPLPKSFVRCSMRSSRTLSISYRDESRMNSGGPDGIVLHCLLYFPHHEHPIVTAVIQL